MNRFIVNGKKTIKNNKILTTTVSVLFWIGLWWLVSAIFGKEVVLPSPVNVVSRLATNIVTVEFWVTAVMSLLRITAGFFCALGLGILLSVIAFYVPIIKTLLSPVVSLFRATPIASFILLLYIWLNTAVIPIVAAFLIVFPVIWENVSVGLENTDKKLEEVCKIYNIKGLKKLKVLYLPSLKPYLSAAILASSGMAWKAGVAAEVLTTPRNSIGRELYNSKVYLESADLFAWTAVVIALSFLISLILRKRLEKSNGNSQ